MLVLGREPGESIRLEIDGRPIGHVHILSFSGSTVRVGLELPADVKVIRSELERKPTTSSDEDLSRGRQTPRNLRHFMPPPAKQ